MTVVKPIPRPDLSVPPDTVTKSAKHLVASLARSMPYETAAAWVHAGALARHAVVMGLVDARSTIRGTVEAIASSHPGLAALADPAANRIWTDAQTDETPILDLWADADLVGAPGRGGIDTAYYLGDLYQWLSVEANKGRALAQTPRFVTDLLIDCTLPHAIDEWGIRNVRAVDPSCGTGHVLVDTMLAIFRQLTFSNLSRPDRIGHAVAAVAGADLDPYAAALARYRLLAAACRLDGGHGRLTDTHGWMPQVAVANSLLTADEPLLARGQYQIAIGNPPYITVKDAQVNKAIRAAYPEVCGGKYSLALPFFKLMTDLCVEGGWVAQITANSFMKREFGTKFVVEYLPKLDLRWVIDTSGAYIPGHGTPTVILIHRNRPPSSDTIHTVLGKRGEPSQPADPAEGLVWRAIAESVGRVESNDRFLRGAAASASTHDCGPRLAVAPRVADTRETYTQPSLFDLLDAA